MTMVEDVDPSRVKRTMIANPVSTPKDLPYKTFDERVTYKQKENKQ